MIGGDHTAVVVISHEGIDRRKVLGRARGRVAVEAATPFGWERYVGSADAVVGMRSYGASAPAGDLFKHFGITAEVVAAAAKARL